MLKKISNLKHEQFFIPESPGNLQVIVSLANIIQKNLYSHQSSFHVYSNLVIFVRV